jgi:AAA family ATP:ADP antiporter
MFSLSATASGSHSAIALVKENAMSSITQYTGSRDASSPSGEASGAPGHTGEPKRVALAFAAFFLILCSYYILRPVRDTMAVQYGAGRLQYLFTATFVFTLLIVPCFGWVVKRVPRAYVLPAVYGFVIANLIAFYAAFAASVTLVSAAAFFIWLSVFNLFVVSLFWSSLSDSFSTEESHRLYGYVAAGGTAGALGGPSMTALLATRVETTHLLALSTGLLAAAAVCMVALRLQRPADMHAASKPIGGAIAAGIPLTMKSSSLRSIALLVICYSTVSTVLYIELIELVGKRFSNPAERTAFFASMDLAVNGLALVMQILGTRQIVQRFGLRTALSMTPLLIVACLAAIGLWRSVTGLAIAQILHRAGEYSIGKPSREMIYTTVDPESRYKAKNFIDTAIYRASDAGSAWLVATIRGAGLDAIVFAAIPVALAWLVASFRVGRQHDRHEST